MLRVDLIPTGFQKYYEHIPVDVKQNLLEPEIPHKI